MDVTISQLATVAGLVISSGVVPFVWKQSLRLEVLERMFNEKRADLDEVRATQEDNNKRLANVEAAIVEIRNVVPELRKVGEFCGKMEAYVEGTHRRLELVENKVFQTS